MNRRSILRFFGLAALVAPFKATAAPAILGADVTSQGITFSGLAGARRFGFTTMFDAAGEPILLLKSASAGKSEMLLDSIGWQSRSPARLMSVPRLRLPWSPPVVVEVSV